MAKKSSKPTKGKEKARSESAKKQIEAYTHPDKRRSNKRISDKDIRLLKFVVCAKDIPSGADVLLEQLSIRAESLSALEE
jgi:hypothetical protein